MIKQSYLKNIFICEMIHFAISYKKTKDPVRFASFNTLYSIYLNGLENSLDYPNLSIQVLTDQFQLDETKAKRSAFYKLLKKEYKKLNKPYFKFQEDDLKLLY